MRDIRWEPVRVRLRDLKPWERNPRQMSKRAAERLLQSWREYGQVQTVAIGPNGEVYDGHQRLSALLSAHGPDYEILALRASRPLTEQERERLVLLLHAGAMGEWDWDVLANWDADALIAGGFDEAMLDALNRDAAALSKLLESAVADVVDEPPDAPEAQVDRAEELRAAWGVEPGQLWRIPSRSVPGGEHRIICGDSTNVEVVARLMQGERADAVVTDPPYDMDAGLVLSTIALYADRACVLTGTKQAFSLVRDGWEYRLDLVWRHRQPRSFPTQWQPVFYHHNIVMITRGGVKLGWARPYPSFGSVIEIDGPEFANDLLGHGKAVAVFSEILSGFSWSLWCDPFLGSGASLLACESQGKVLRGVELQPEIFAVALQRFADAGLSPELVS